MADAPRGALVVRRFGHARLPVQNRRLRYLTRSLEQEKYKPLGAR